ncbi:hypothetical protein TNCV_4231001 [Trichonephila clavipes]|uniref:Uncharacterized protein n=1 Tax=Trichonephila clavipes TaxID=2585209 RepID=A0A8X6SNK8_TRICX|nr:hypothetical protein TNCV_4231001 [Trichonephila clavipes]
MVAVKVWGPLELCGGVRHTTEYDMSALDVRLGVKEREWNIVDLDSLSSDAGGTIDSLLKSQSEAPRELMVDNVILNRRQTTRTTPELTTTLQTETPHQWTRTKVHQLFYT